MHCEILCTFTSVVIFIYLKKIICTGVFVSTSAVDRLEGSVSNVTYCVLIRMLNMLPPVLLHCCNHCLGVRKNIQPVKS